jgi:hypothetical protein
MIRDIIFIFGLLALALAATASPGAPITVHPKLKFYSPVYDAWPSAALVEHLSSV